MKYKTNKLMDNRLGGRDIFELAKQYPLEPKLQEILDKGISIENEISFFEYFRKRLGKKERTIIEDKIGLEMFVNDFHVDFYIPKEKLNPEYVLQQSVAFVEKLNDMLVSLKNDKKYEIILSTNEGEDANSNICVIGFYTIHSIEKWLLEDLDGYKMDGLLVIEV